MTPPVFSTADISDQASSLARLGAIQDVRLLFARYMQLCDVPRQPAATVQCLESLFSHDAIWEGVGRHYEKKFGRLEGAIAISKMLMSYLPPSPHFILNGHFLASEFIEVKADEACGQWLMQQISTYQDGSSELIVARLVIDFVRQGETWLIARFRTERLGDFPLPSAPHLGAGS